MPMLERLEDNLRGCPPKKRVPVNLNIVNNINAGNSSQTTRSNSPHTNAPAIHADRRESNSSAYNPNYQPNYQPHYAPNMYSGNTNTMRRNDVRAPYSGVNVPNPNPRMAVLPMPVEVKEPPPPEFDAPPPRPSAPPLPSTPPARRIVQAPPVAALQPEPEENRVYAPEFF